MSIIEKLGIERKSDGAKKIDCCTIETNYGFEADSILHKANCFDDIFEALIGLMNGVDNMPPVTALENIVSHQWADSCDAVKKATGKTWEEIKALYD